MLIQVFETCIQEELQIVYYHKTVRGWKAIELIFFLEDQSSQDFVVKICHQ